MTAKQARTAAAALLAAFLLGGCAPGQVIEGHGPAGVRRVAVLAAIGDSFHMSEIGVMRWFGNRWSDTPIPDWGLDAEATSIAQRLLEAKGTYQVFAVPTRRHAEITKALRPMLIRGVDVEAMRGIVRAEQPQAAVDAFLVIGKSRGREPCTPPMPPVLVEGIGICAGPRIQMSPAAPGDEIRDVVGPYGNRMLAPFASYRMTLFRASDLKVLADRAAAVHRRERDVFGLPKPTSSVPYREIHADAYKESFDQFTEDDKRAIRRVIIELLETSIPETLKTMGMISD